MIQDRSDSAEPIASSVWAECRACTALHVRTPGGGAAVDKTQGGSAPRHADTSLLQDGMWAEPRAAEWFKIIVQKDVQRENTLMKSSVVLDFIRGKNT